MRLLSLVESFSIAIGSLFLLLKLLFVLYIPCSFPSPRFSSICDCSYLIFYENPFALPVPTSPGQAIPWAVLHHQLVLERAFSEEVTAAGVSFTGCWWGGGFLVQGAIPRSQNSPQHAHLAWWWVKLMHMQYTGINIQVDSCRELRIYRRQNQAMTARASLCLMHWLQLHCQGGHHWDTPWCLENLTHEGVLWRDWWRQPGHKKKAQRLWYLLKRLDKLTEM